MRSIRGTVRALRFADFLLDLDVRALRRNGEVVPLQRRPFDLLLYLIQHRDRVVPQDELMREVWQGIHVNGQSLRFALHAARRALGDRGDRQRFICTFPRRGLRFVGAVDEVRRGDWSAEGLAGVVGRRTPLEMVARGISEVRAGAAGRSFILSGEAGIGKTTLLRVIERQARAEGLIVARARCDGRRNAPAFWPWTLIIRSLLEDASKMDAHASLASVPELGWLLPELAKGSELPGSPASDAQSARLRLFEGVTRAIGIIANIRPVLLCIDDVHEADDGTALLASHIVRQSGDLPLLTAIAYRSTGEEGNESVFVAEMAGQVASGAIALSLAGLEIEDFRSLIRQRAGVTPSPAVVQNLHDRTAGNPFFLKVLLDLVEQEGRVGDLELPRPTTIQIPSEVQGAVLRQVDRLPKSTRNLLQSACVIGLEWREALLREISGLSFEEIDLALEPARAAGIVSEGEKQAAWRFSHPLVRECLYASLSPTHRRATHLHAARVMVKHEDRPGGPLAAEIARQFAAAAPLDGSERGIEYYLKAADIDVERAGFDAARGSLHAAWKLAGAVGLRDTGSLARLWLRIGIVDGLLLRRSDSRNALGRASRLAIDAGCADIACDAALAFSPHLLAIETGVYDSELVAILRRAMSVSESASVGAQARVAARTAVALHWSQDASNEIGALIRLAKGLAEESRDAEVSAYVSVAESLATYSPGSADLPAIETEIASGDPSVPMMSRVLRVTRLLEAGAVVAADAEVDQLRQVVDQSRIASARWYIEMFGSTLALLRGDYVTAMALGDSYLKQGMAVDDRNAFHSFALQRAMIALDLGPVDESESAVAAMASKYPTVEGWDAGLCLVQTEIGKFREAEERLDRLVARGVFDSVRRNAWLGTIGCLTLAARRLDRVDLAQPLYDLWKPYEGCLAVLGFGSFCWGAADRFLGVLASLAEKHELAEAHFKSAVELNTRVGARPSLAHCLRDWGASGCESGDGGKALLTRAAELSKELGMSRLNAQLEIDLAR